MAHEFNFLKEISPEYSLEGLLLKLKLQYFGHLMWRTDSLTKPTGEDPDSGENWRQKEKGEAEDEMVRRHHRLNGHEFEQTPGDNGRQRGQAYHSPWGRTALDMTWQLNNLFTVYLSLPYTAWAFIFALCHEHLSCLLFCVLRTWLSNCLIGAKKIWPDRIVAHSPLNRCDWTETWVCITARVQPTAASSQGSCLSLSFSQLSLDIGKVVSCTFFGDISYIRGVVQYCQEYLLFVLTEIWQVIWKHFLK